MPVAAGGFLHWRKERYLMDDAIAIWDGDSLSVYGKSDECGLYFCGIPFGSAARLDIKGRSYSGEGETTFSEGTFDIAGEQYNMDSGTITCIGVSSTLDSVALEFNVVVNDRPTRKLTGGIRCRVVSEFEPKFAGLS